MNKEVVENIIEQLCNEFPNDYELGDALRKNETEINDSILSECIKIFPNDYDLGKFIRKLWNK